MIDAQTKLVGVMGWPIAHSLSPAMHNAAFDALGLNWRYVAFPVHPRDVGRAIDGLEALGFRGTNVTVPHKEAVIPHLDAIPERVRRFGAVNTIIVDRETPTDGSGSEDDGETGYTLRGENTDVEGFIYALRQGGFDPQGRRVLVVGAGGGARGVVYGLCGAGAGEVVVLNRSAERAERLVADLLAHPCDTGLTWGALGPQALARQAGDCELLVNTTTVGMWPHADASIWPDDHAIPAHLAVCDLVYRPLETKLLRQAREAGAMAIDGLGMLVAQGVLSFQMWTGKWPPEDVMRAACEAALESRNQ